MSTTQFLNFFLNIHALVLLSFLMSYFIHSLIAKNRMLMTANVELRFNHILVFLVFLLPLAALQLSDRFHFKPIAKTYMAVTYKDYDQLKKQKAKESEQFALTDNQNSQGFPIETLKNMALLIIIATVFYSFRQVYFDYRKLHRLTQNIYPYRRFGKINIAFSENIRVPFSFKSLRKAWVVVPLKFVENPQLLRLSILHELQHHRQKDTQWIYFFQLMKALVGINPAFHQWCKIIFEIQEFKVDETLIDQGKVKRQEYARCLIEVAETVAQIEKPLVCATGLAFLPKRQELTRRIESMYKQKTTSRMALTLMGSLILVSMTAVAFPTSKAIDSRSLTMSDAEKMAKHARANTNFPIAMNEMVLDWLNYYLGTVQGRDFVKQSLVRMQQHRPLIERKLAEYNMPIELLAVPAVESGYQNLPSSANRTSGAAGLWQFIENTAVVFGLDPTKVPDERLDIEKETDAAMRYLLANKLVFNSWELSLLSYNAGESSVKEAIRKTGSRDAWTLIRKGFENDKGYLAKVMAMVLIMKNPSALD